MGRPAPFIERVPEFRWLEACLRAGMVTEGELEREGVLTRALHSRALVVKPLGQRPLRAGLAKL